MTLLTIGFVCCFLKHKLVRDNQCVMFFIHLQRQRYFSVLPPVFIQQRALDSSGKRTDNFAGVTATGVSLWWRRTTTSNTSELDLVQTQPAMSNNTNIDTFHSVFKKEIPKLFSDKILWSSRKQQLNSYAI